MKLFLPLIPILLLGGCGKGTPAGTQKDTDITPVVSIPNSPRVDTEAILNSANQILQAASLGTINTNLITSRFKAIIAEPVFEDDKVRGYSDTGAKDWLKSNSMQLLNTKAKLLYATDSIAYVHIQNGVNNGVMKLTKTSATPWAIDGITRTQANGNAKLPSMKTEQEYAYAYSIVVCLDSLFANQPELAESVLDQRTKAKLAPPFDSDKARGYNRGALRNTMAGWVKGFTNYHIEGIQTTNINTVARVTLTNGTTDKKYSITLGYDAATGQGTVLEFAPE